MCSKSRVQQLWKKPHLQHFNQLKSYRHASLPRKVELKAGHAPLGLMISLASAGYKFKNPKVLQNPVYNQRLILYPGPH